MSNPTQGQTPKRANGIFTLKGTQTSSESITRVKNTVRLFTRVKSLRVVYKTAGHCLTGPAGTLAGVWPAWPYLVRLPRTIQCGAVPLPPPWVSPPSPPCSAGEEGLSKDEEGLPSDEEDLPLPFSDSSSEVPSAKTPGAGRILPVW